MPDLSHLKIKFKIKTWIFPNFRFWNGSARSESKVVQFDITDFKMLNITHQDKLPNRYYHVVVDESKLDAFYEEVINRVIRMHENVSEVEVSLSGKGVSIFWSAIRNQKLTKTLNKLIFKLPGITQYAEPTEELVKKVQKTKNYKPYLTSTNKWAAQAEIPSYEYVLCEHIGHTGRSDEEGKKGAELKCTITLKGDTVNTYDYVFLKLNKLIYISPTGIEYEFYFITESVEKQLLQEFKRLAIKHRMYSVIELQDSFFDEYFVKTINSYMTKNINPNIENGFVFKIEYDSLGNLLVKRFYGNILYHSSKSTLLGLPITENRSKLDNIMEMGAEVDDVARRRTHHGDRKYEYLQKIDYVTAPANIYWQQDAT